MNELTDQQLLRDYAEHRAEPAFAEVVRRHVDLVYSAAWRMVGDAQLAEDVTQNVFVTCAREAGKLTSHPVLAGWLHCTTRNLAANVVRSESRRQAREQEAFAMNELLANGTDVVWEQVAPELDAALGELEEADRDAVLLRYFQKRSAREMAATLGVSEDAAQRRVSRAVERLRELFAKRGLTVGVSGLAVIISANAIQAAPVGLVSVITSTTALTAAATSVTIKTIAMTTLQKSVVTVALAAAVGTGIYETHQASVLKKRVQALEQHQAPLEAQLKQQASERRDAEQRLAVLQDDNTRLNRNTGELMKLRDEVGRLRDNQSAFAQQNTTSTSPHVPETDEQTANKNKGHEMGLAVVRGEPGALEKIESNVLAELAVFKSASAGLNDQQRGELSASLFAPTIEAMKVIQEAALNGDATAIDAEFRALTFKEIHNSAFQAIGALAAAGNERAMEIVFDPEKYNVQPSIVVGALQTLAENGDQRAIDRLAAIALDIKHQALWFMAANSLRKAAEAGNEVAIDALVSMSSSTNINVRSAVINGLNGPASHQNAKAVAALAAMH